MTTEPEGLILRMLRELGAGQDRIEAVLTDHSGRLQRLDMRTTSIDRRLSEVAVGISEDTDRINRRLDDIDRRVRRLEDAAAP